MERHPFTQEENVAGRRKAVALMPRVGTHGEQHVDPVHRALRDSDCRFDERRGFAERRIAERAVGPIPRLSVVVFRILYIGVNVRCADGGARVASDPAAESDCDGLDDVGRGRPFVIGELLLEAGDRRRIAANFADRRSAFVAFVSVDQLRIRNRLDEAILDEFYDVRSVGDQLRGRANVQLLEPTSQATWSADSLLTSSSFLALLFPAARRLRASARNGSHKPAARTASCADV